MWYPSDPNWHSCVTNLNVNSGSVLASFLFIFFVSVTAVVSASHRNHQHQRRWKHRRLHRLLFMQMSGWDGENKTDVRLKLDVLVWGGGALSMSWRRRGMFFSSAAEPNESVLVYGYGADAAHNCLSLFLFYFCLTSDVQFVISI